ncbi:MAG: glycosyltransferase family 4 protein [Desulfobulbaceae bacterium]|nr:glycosyltransferase family 4 protein [Desulfobulbaceae bacterium]
MRIFSPMSKGNGAYIVHQELAERIKGYTARGYNPYLTLFPLLLPFCCRGTRPDIIHTTPDYAMFFRKKGVPLVVSFHNIVLDPFMGQHSSFMQNIHYKTDLRYFTAQALGLASVVTSVSHFVADLVQKEFGYNKEIRVIYNGVDNKKFSPKKIKQRKKIRVLFSGNLTRRKGAYLLPEIAKKLDDGIEIIYTQGLRTGNTLPPSGRLRNIGSVPFFEMPRVYQGADILLFPTVREGFGLAAAEAMACGLPVVATNCSSLPELVVHGRGGYLCELGNVDDFAARINELASSSSLRHQMGEFNRVRVEENFSMDMMVDGYKKLFSEVVDNP